MLNRLFVKLPLYLIFFICLVTVVIPIGYWVITGNDYLDFMEKIDYL